jgi:hypothetical protein
MTAIPPAPTRLSTTHAQVRTEIQRADTKAATLLALVGATLAGVIALTGRPVPGPALAALWLAAVPITASVLVLLATVQPRVSSSRRPAVPGTWLHAAQVGPATLLEAYHRTHDDLTLAQDVCVLARLAWAKYRQIQAAVVLLVCGLSTLAVALVLAVTIS